MKQPLRILLIDLGSTRKEINEPIGICAVASYAKKHISFAAEIDLIFFPLSKHPTRLELSSYDLVGLSTKIGSLEQIRDISTLLLEIPINVRPILVLGDLIATFATKQILQIFEHAICVVGEGEVAFLQLLESVRHARSLGVDLRHFLAEKDINHLAFVLNGLIVKSRGQLVNMSTCPAPDRTFAKSVASMGGIIRVEGSRGCAWGRCSFCAIQHKYCNETQWRPIATERIINELQIMSSLGIRSPFFTDEDFIGNDPLRAIELSNKIIEAKRLGQIDKNFNIYVNMRVDSILSKPHKGIPSGSSVLKNFRRAGLREVFIGIESGSKEQVKRYKKASTVDRNALAIRVLKEAGLTYDLGFIMFDPEMTIHELSTNIEFLIRAGLSTHDARLTKSLRIESGTPIVDEYFAKDMIIGDIDVDQLVYPYRWNNSNVEDTYNAYSEWENICINDIYTIQATTRGEVLSELLRTEWRTGLGEIREIELSALKYLTNQADRGKNATMSALHELQGVRIEKVSNMLEIINFTRMAN